MNRTRPESNYRLNCGQYVLHSGDTPIGRVLDEVAIAVDRDGPVMHKHGPRETVEAWANSARERLRSQGGMGAEMAENLVVLCGRFPVGELNKLLVSTGYIEEFMRKLEAGEMQQEPIPGMT